MKLRCAPLDAVRLRAAVLAGVCMMVFSVVARAHDPGISTAQANIEGASLRIVTGFAPADAQMLLPAGNRGEDRWTETEFAAVHGPLLAVAPTLWDVRSGDRVLSPHDARVELLPGDNVSFALSYQLPAGLEKLLLRASKVPDLPPAHRQFVIVSDERGSTLTKKLLSARDFSLEVALPPASVGSEAAPTGPGDVKARDSAPPDTNEVPTALGFLKLGVEHIWTGFDHLLFLFALLIVCRTFRSIVAIITCFTVAHSVTLALATLEVVRLPAQLVEVVIAASIVYVGAENLLRRGEEPRGRWVLTFAFGLVHGFGFASVLRDLGVGSGAQGVVLPLVTFNLGVELGQIAIAAVVLPLIWQLRKQERFVRQGIPALSAIVLAAGMYWLLERTLLA